MTSDAGDRRNWAEGGLIDLDANRVGREVQGSSWRTPVEIRLDGGRLRWERPWTNTQVVRGSAGLLDIFLNLASGSDTKILAFARKYGVVTLCEEHAFPITHNMVTTADFQDAVTRCTPLGDDNPFVPTEWYRSLALRFRSVLNIAALLHQGRRGQQDDWIAVHSPAAKLDDVAYDVDWQKRRLSSEEIVASDREMLAEILDHWLRQSGVRLRFSWTEADPEFGITPMSLFGHLTATLIFAVTRSDGFAFCSACGRPYVPSRRPSIGRRHYCTDPECRKASRSDAQRDARARRARQANAM